MLLRDIITELELLEQICPEFLDTQITDITSDSRSVSTGSLFIAINGHTVDGHKFIESAIEKGAVAVLYSDDAYTKRITDGKAVPLKVESSWEASIQVSANFFRHPDREITVVGVTGTNGKTTIATLLYRLFSKLGYRCGLLSTIANYVGEEKFPTANTTADPITLRRLMRRMADTGCQYCFMEVSSHALEQGRVRGLDFTGAIFTNLTHDHLDYHKTFSEYIRCKKILFDTLPSSAFALINADDRNGKIMVQNTKAKVMEYGLNHLVDFKAAIIEKSLEGSLLRINSDEVWTRFIGRHNAYNIAAVYGTALLLGANKDEVLKEISLLEPVSGRMEILRGGDSLTVVVDYAHTPDALENVMRTLKEVSPSSPLTALFGCGGDRDRTKRPEMAEAVARYADRIIITSDNPRSEDPVAIINDVEKGIPQDKKSITLSITDRAEAIRTAIKTAPKGGIILLAGKGHEDYQIINGVKTHFDDKEQACNALSELK